MVLHRQLWRRVLTGLTFVCSATVAICFCVSVAAAVRDWSGLRSAGNRLRGRTGSLPNGLAASVVGAEALCALARCVPAGDAVRLGMYGATAMLAVFTCILLRAIRAGTAGGCHCFGSSDDDVDSVDAFRTALLLGLSGYGACATTLGVAPVPRLGLVVALLGPSAGLALLVINLGPIIHVLRAPLSDD
jgi:hypothetical protein